MWVARRFALRGSASFPTRADRTVKLRRGWWTLVLVSSAHVLESLKSHAGDSRCFKGIMKSVMEC